MDEPASQAGAPETVPGTASPDATFVMQPLYRARGWISWLGVATFLAGCPALVLAAVVGVVLLAGAADLFLIVGGGLAVWFGYRMVCAGLQLVRAAGDLDRGYPADDAQTLGRAVETLRGAARNLAGSGLLFLLACFGWFVALPAVGGL